jgi:hypothetical protein
VIAIGLTGPEEVILVPIVDEWKVTGAISWMNGSSMVENILLASADGTGYVPLNVDENGTFAEYVPTGDYVIVVALMLNGDGVMEFLRMLILVNADLL